jgi:hypothetical protein
MLAQLKAKIFSKKNKAQFGSWLRGLAVLGVAAILHSVKVPDQYTALLAATTAPLLHWLNPKDKTVGIGAPK